MATHAPGSEVKVTRFVLFGIRYSRHCLFWDQFSDRSQYNIDIDYTNDANFDISFCHRRVRKLLSNIDSNKANGPDAINGKILRFCAVSLAYPLSLLFTLSYNMGSVPKEWKLANVVPIHKKGSKENV